MTRIGGYANGGCALQIRPGVAHLHGGYPRLPMTSAE